MSSGMCKGTAPGLSDADRIAMLGATASKLLGIPT
jgi:hypothetical protein